MPASQGPLTRFVEDLVSARWLPETPCVSNCSSEFKLPLRWQGISGLQTLKCCKERGYFFKKYVTENGSGRKLANISSKLPVPQAQALTIQANSIRAGVLRGFKANLRWIPEIRIVGMC